MTKLAAAETGRSVVVRWRMLAERRLNYLIELYESGRWKLYHNEPEFLSIVREARAALQAWEALAPPDAARDKPVEIALAQPVEIPAAVAAPSLAMKALQASANGVGAQNDLREA